MVPRGQGGVFEDCGETGPPEEPCLIGPPGPVKFHPTADRHVLVDIRIIDEAYPGPDPREIGRLRGRVVAGTRAAETTVVAESVPYRPGPLEEVGRSGGFRAMPRTDVFAPATELRPGLVTILGPGFLRGDSNADAASDVSDAIATLGFLFLGAAEPGCMDGADVDDSGIVEITDPIFLLAALFLGGPPPPPPGLVCGSDDTPDELGCAIGCEAQG